MKMHYLMACLIMISLLPNLIFGQQWDGASNTTDPIYRTGKVGVGTNAPKQKLHIEGGSDASLSDGSGYIIIGNQDGTNLVMDNNEFIARNNGGESTLYLQSEGGAINVHHNQAGGTQFVILDNGKVGIGTESPGAKLDVDGGTLDTSPTGTPIARFSRGSGGDNFIAIYGDNIGNYIIADDPGSNEKNLYIRTKNSKHIILDPAGKVGIGTTSPQSKLAVNGIITAKEVVVTNSGWPDFVFDDDYYLRTLDELETYTNEHKHLPDMPSASEVEGNGVSLGDMQAKLLQKVEELTLYIIELKKENGALKARVAKLEI
ncbi:MAG: hypothetical protein JSU77_05675 [Fidelibacterota bacterium]|nr:MAG: hypothetical protein JSU77_05675 [Candidatus Neomarinimicrobiota bacterium]